MSFIAFISYSRKDKMVADWLHKNLERYRIPDSILATTTLHLNDKYLRKIFIDRQDLHVDVRPFTEEIQERLRESQFLIVLCSKNSAKSEFVNKEILYFLETHNNNSSLILPLFIDDVAGSIPPAFIGTTIMDRHFPIYNTKLSKNSEGNRYCLYQIVSYILGADFADIYNRYENQARQEQKQKSRKYVASICVLCALMVLISAFSFFYYQEKNKVIEHQERLIKFEKGVFPQAVVHGYERNFLTPVIRHLKDKGEYFTIHILMPTNERDLTHQGRVTDINYDLKVKFGIDSISNVHLATETRRGSRIMRLFKNGSPVDGVFIDFATTTTSFLDIAKYKRNHYDYKDVPLDEIISDYAFDFIDQTKAQLKSDSVFVKFYTDRSQFVDSIGSCIR